MLPSPSLRHEGARRCFWLLLLFTGVLAPTLLRGFQSPSDFEHGVVRYASSTPSDPVAKLQEKLDAGSTKLAFDEKFGYLPSVLNELAIPRSSQTLVFSKTSLQLILISPQSPRALYFNDDVYIGAVQGSEFLEIASVDPKLGAVFYTLSQKENDQPKFEREFFVCLLCHDSSSTQGVPGLTMLSVITDGEGAAIQAAGTISMTDRTPFHERWGGWYVTGTHGAQRHWGNLTSPVRLDTLRDPKSLLSRLDLNAGANLSSLDSRFDTSRYLAGSSDLVSLMVMTHQTRTHNLITKASYDVQTALQEEAEYRRAGANGELSDITQGRIRAAVDPLLRAMLFTWEAELTAPIAGNTRFAADFAKAGPADRKGRSLRDLDLTTRLFKYRLSYLIYSESFNAMPDAAKTYFYRKLRDYLTGRVQATDYPDMPASEKQAILEILADTKPDFAALGA